MQDLNISIIQSFLHWENKEKNFSMFEKKIASIKEASDLIILPEMFNTGFSMHPEKLAEEQEGITLEWMKSQAIEKDCVICGSYIVKENNDFFNRLVFVNQEGSFQYYDKHHLFRMGNEHESFSQGKERIIVEYKSWKILPQVCYDLRFPVWSKNNFVENRFDYDLIIYVANWPAVRSKAWKALLKARAIENQAYVVGVNRIGCDGNDKNHSGDSRIIDPLGQNIAKIKSNTEGIKSVKLSYKELKEYRESFAVGLDWDSFEVVK